MNTLSPFITKYIITNHLGFFKKQGAFGRYYS